MNICPIMGTHKYKIGNVARYVQAKSSHIFFHVYLTIKYLHTYTTYMDTQLQHH